MQGSSRAALLLAACAFLASAAVQGQHDGESPVAKVIKMLEDLKTEVEDAGSSEAKLYDEFACFCKDTTKEKSDAIKEEQDNIEEFAAAMQENTDLAAAENKKALEREADIDAQQKSIEKIVAMRQAEEAHYEGTAADLAKGIKSLEAAIEQVSSSKASSLIHLKTSLRKSLLLADDLDVAPKHVQKLTAFLQAGEPDEGEEYNFHAQDLIDTFSALNKQFTAKKADVDAIDARNKEDFQDMLKTKSEEKTTLIEAKETAYETKDAALATLAEKTDSLVEEQASLKDNQQYLKELTSQCELKAREWDQQSQMRSDEVTALTKALEIINAKVKDNDAAVNKRDLIQVGAERVPQQKAHHALDVSDTDIHGVAMSFLEVKSPRKQLSLLAKKVAAASDMDAERAGRKDRALYNLAQWGTKHGSPALTALAMRASADPFLKVKRLIQDLIEKLIAEANDEVTKKGWCDGEIGKANNNRNDHMDRIMKTNADLSALEAQKATLEEEIRTLTSEIADLNAELAKASKARVADKAENMDTLEKASEGLAAVKDAYNVLATFYKGAAKGKVSLVQAPEGQAGGAYKGNQAKGGGILAMLDVIIGDFQKTIKETKKAEKVAAREFKQFEIKSEGSIANKETSKSSDEFALKETDASILESLDTLGKTQKMLDDTLKTLEDLKPSCFEAGQSYEDRVQKRNDEISALKKAMCEMDPDKAEEECKEEEKGAKKEE